LQRGRAGRRSTRLVQAGRPTAGRRRPRCPGGRAGSGNQGAGLHGPQGDVPAVVVCAASI